MSAEMLTLLSHSFVRGVHANLRHGQLADRVEKNYQSVKKIFLWTKFCILEQLQDF